MIEKETRRSDRFNLRLPLQVSGTDSVGRVFMDETWTIALSRHGGKVLLARKLAPDQELTIRCHSTQKETVARVVGHIAETPEGSHYGVAFLDRDVNIWDVEFPLLSESEQAVARILLECTRCQALELVYLDEMEMEVFEANRRITRPCKKCSDASLWKQSLAQPPEAPPREPAPPLRAANERKSLRVAVRVTARIRHPQHGEETVTTENVSRGGLAFKSTRQYGQDVPIEVAVPYAPGAVNIFAPARIVHTRHLLEEGLTLYGVRYLPVHKGWPET